MCTEAEDRVPTPKGRQDGRLIAYVGISETRGPMPCTETALGILNESMGLLSSALAHHETDYIVGYSGFIC